jgi:thiol-disulfide isomerase/thioredoxin
MLVARLAEAGALAAGDRLPAFDLVAWDGTRLVPADVAGKPVVVDFWASWCVTCRAALPALDAMAERLRDRGVVVLAVNVDRDRSAADAWLAARLPDRHVRLAHDPEGTFLARCGASGMPAAYVVDRTGVVRFAEAGYAADRVAAIEGTVESLLVPAAEPARAAPNP